MRKQLEQTSASFSRCAYGAQARAQPESAPVVDRARPKLRAYGASGWWFALLAAAAVSCGPAATEPNVEFAAGGAIGSWQVPDAASDAGPPSDQVVSRTPSESVGQQTHGAGRAAPPSTANAADSGMDVEPPAASATVTSLVAQVTTSAVGGRYQPKNIGAIWIEDDAGQVVKTLQIWAGTRRRYLTGYLAAMAGRSIDVTASATMSRHQTHTVTWDLKDRSGASVAPGTYRVRMELTDANTTGRSNVVDVDTTQGPRTLTPSDAPSFSAIRIELK